MSVRKDTSDNSKIITRNAVSVKLKWSAT